jgi:hypothetical protein
MTLPLFGCRVSRGSSMLPIPIELIGEAKEFVFHM